MTLVKLTPAEMITASMAGIMRQVENLKIGRKPAHGVRDDAHWQTHIEGALGEAALAKYLGVYWPGKGGLREADVGNVDVRTGAKHTHRLILHPDDPDERVFYLVTGTNGTYQVHGWIRGRDGKRPEFWSDPAGGRPAFFIPHSALNQGEVIQ